MRFFDYAKGLVLHFDFGTTVLQDEPVRPLIFAALPNTLMLVLGAAVGWFLSGVVIARSPPSGAAPSSTASR